MSTSGGINGPGGRGFSNPPPSYAKIIETSPLQYKRNVLEIHLEKTGAAQPCPVNSDFIADICRQIGLNLELLEGHTVYVGRRGVRVDLWAKQGVQLESFLREEPVNFGGGWGAFLFKLAGNLSRTMTIVGLDFLIHDQVIEDYFTQFGVKMSSKIVKYGKFPKGPWAGKINGNRIHQIDVSDSCVLSEPFTRLQVKKYVSCTVVISVPVENAIRIKIPAQVEDSQRTAYPPESTLISI